MAFVDTARKSLFFAVAFCHSGVAFGACGQVGLAPACRRAVDLMTGARASEQVACRRAAYVVARMLQLHAQCLPPGT